MQFAKTKRDERRLFSGTASRVFGLIALESLSRRSLLISRNWHPLFAWSLFYVIRPCLIHNVQFLVVCAPVRENESVAVSRTAVRENEFVAPCR